jgi:hypothetical protein
MFTKIAIIGIGNIGTWLYKTLKTQSNLLVVLISSRNIKTLPIDFDLYIFALKDDVYKEVLLQISFQMSHAVHTSGSLSQQILAPFAYRVGVVYPYQTITREALGDEQVGKWTCGDGEKEKGINYEVPICIEASDSFFEFSLFQWANSIFPIVYKINEKQRFEMHMAAVFANNFTNAMYGIAYQIFKKNNLDWSLIFPLLHNTMEKAKYNDPNLIQTGPAKRGDFSIMDKHCNDLSDEDLKNLYKLVSKIITKNNK